MEAEVLRDSMLAISGELSADAGGPGTYPEINEDLANQPRLIMGQISPAYQPSPTRRDLAEALRATLDGKPIAQTGTPAVGCILSDFLR